MLYAYTPFLLCDMGYVRHWEVLQQKNDHSDNFRPVSAKMRGDERHPHCIAFRDTRCDVAVSLSHSKLAALLPITTRGHLTSEAFIGLGILEHLALQCIAYSRLAMQYAILTVSMNLMAQSVCK